MFWYQCTLGAPP